MENLILVDKNDQPIGVTEKFAAHQGSGLLHRAFTVFLRNSEGKYLITRRSADKPLWPLWWDGACSSHQRPGELDLDAARRRLSEELDLSAEKLHYEFKYYYQVGYNDQLGEHEINHIILGLVDENPRPNPAEVAGYKWQTVEEIDAILADPNQQTFAPWFPLAWVKLRQPGL